MRVNTYTKPSFIKDRIVSVKIEGSRFLKNVTIDFNQDLNTLIGGRGVGKSAIIETIRYCLDLPVYSEKSFREDFVKSVVGSGGKIELITERVFGDTQQCYKIKRIIGQLPEVEGKDIPLTELFEEKTPLLIGQKELYALSSDDKFQLSLIDELIGDEIKKELSSKGLAPDRYEALVKEKTTLEPLLKEYEKINEQIKNLQKDRGKIKSAIKEKRHQLFTVRKNKIEKLNKKLVGRIQMEVLYLANRSEFKEYFKNLLSGSVVSLAAIGNIIEGEKVSIDGIELSQAIAEGIEKIKELFGLTDAMASRIINWFSEKEKLYELETIFPDDKIIIKLKVGDGYSELSKLSAGQKATALLILLFAQDDRILIIDQPEEDLDNRFICEDVVKILREIKNKRQIILVTKAGILGFL